MADISQIKLPDGTTYNLKDSYVRTNYRALSNNDFDTINVTELNAGDLIVTGAARFLNTINGSVSGTSSNVTGTVAIANGGTGATSAANARTNLAVPNMISDTYPTLLPTNGSNNWIKIGTSNSSYGLLPSVAGNAGSGHNYLGTSTWYWKYAYIDEIYGTLKGNADTATKANILNGFNNGGAGNIAWGNQTGTGIWYNNDANGGSVGFRTNNPTSGQVSMIIDGTVYIKEGAQDVAAAVKSFSVSGQTVTYTNLWGGTGTFSTQDTKNTAGSTDTSSKIFLIGATSQAANPQTYSHDTAYVGADGCLYSGGVKVLTAHQDISGKVSKTGDTMSGALTVEASNSYSSYNEGIRINAGARTYATLLMGGTNGTTSGTNDGAFWIGVYNTGTTARRLMIAHNGSTNTGTYFYASSSSDISPSLRVGSNLQVANVISANVSNSGTAGGISLYSTDPTSFGVAMRSTSNGGKHGAVQGDWAIYNYMNGYNTARGWIWRNSYGNNTNIASLDVYGNAVFNGYVGIGGNETNTSGVRQVYNETTKSLDFVFVA